MRRVTTFNNNINYHHLGNDLHKLPFSHEYVLEARVLRLGNAGWYFVTKVSIFLRTFLFLCSSAFFLSWKMTSERCFSTVVAG